MILFNEDLEVYILDLIYFVNVLTWEKRSKKKKILIRGSIVIV